MKRFRRRVGRILSGFVGLRAAQSMMEFGRRQLVVLAYHRVMPMPALPTEYPYDVGLISAEPAEFEWQMRHLAANFNPVKMDQLDAYLRGHGSLPERPVMVTFDDGFRDNYDFAFPILKRTGVSATFFVSTGYVGTTRVFWFQRAAYIIACCAPGSVNLPGMNSALPSDDSPEARQRGMIALHKYLKSKPMGEIASILDELERALFPGGIGHGGAAVATMSWDQIREMADAGMCIGSHTVNHPILSRLQPDEVHREVSESKSIIEGVLGKPVVSIAYPVGRRHAYNEGVIRACAMAGYRVAMSYEPGGNLISALNPFELRRQNVERLVGRNHFHALNEAPSCFV